MYSVTKLVKLQPIHQVYGEDLIVRKRTVFFSLPKIFKKVRHCDLSTSSSDIFTKFLFIN